MRSRLGFTLIEVLVAVSILAIALTSSGFLLAGAFGTYRHQNQSMELFHVSHDKMETLEGAGYAQLLQMMAQARRPTDPIRDNLPADADFVTNAAGDVTARYRMQPESPDSDVYKIVPHRDGDLIFTQNDAAARRGRIEASVRLQYWDPTFDAPSMTDRGLIRATLNLKGDSGQDQATKYLAR